MAFFYGMLKTIHVPLCATNTIGCDPLRYGTHKGTMTFKVGYNFIFGT